MYKKITALIIFVFIFKLPAFSQEIHQAVYRNDLKKIESLLIEKPILVNKIDRIGRTPLHLAASMGNNKIIELLINNHALVNAGDKDDMTPLHYAALNGHLETVKLLLDKGAAVDARYLGAASALTMAALRDHYEVARYLIDKGANVNLVCNMLVTPLYCTVLNNNDKFLKMFLDEGGEINYRDFTGRSPLQVAVRDGFEKIAQILINHGADKNIREKTFGSTLMHLAASNGHQKIVEILLNNGADLNPKDNFGSTPLDCAHKYGHKDLAEFLRSNKAKSSGKKPDPEKKFFTDLNLGEAIIVKLQGGSWGLKTLNTFLVFGYAEKRNKTSNPSLSNGYITLEEIRGNKVYLFDVRYQSRLPLYTISKEYQDLKLICNDAYKNGYLREGISNIHFPQFKKPMKVDNMEILALPVWGRYRAFYIDIDGITILWLPGVSDNYYPDDKNTEAINYLLKNNMEVDILFPNTPYYENGPEWMSVLTTSYNESENLEAKAIFPMGSENFARLFLHKITGRRHVKNIHCAQNPGDRFYFKNGTIITY